ncbi:MAG TPA: hypothetical protein VLG36_05665 [Candidatus Chromulinivoraceae bacterium]|nr:hypothetical protein [Candidatus Chromulinivoraceae bacterium]
MNLTQKIQVALSGAGLSLGDFTLSSPDDVGGVTVKSMTDDPDHVASARDALEVALPSTEYIVAFNRSITDPAVYVRTRPAGF